MTEQSRSHAPIRENLCESVGDFNVTVILYTPELLIRKGYFIPKEIFILIHIFLSLLSIFLILKT